MLGEQLGDETGQITGVRVLPHEGAGPKIEVSYQVSGTLIGFHVTDIGTTVSVARPDGTFFGESQAVVTTDDGEIETARGQGVGRSTGPGMAMSWRGAIFPQTTSKKLARLDGIVAVYEFDIDENGKVAVKTYEWK